MSLRSFQLALAEAVANPLAAKAYYEEPALLDQRYTLTDTERSRLLDMIQQKGMRINYMLYQTNRMTPLHLFMPYTLRLLNEKTVFVVKEYWLAHRKTPFQFVEEVEGFSTFLKEKIERQELIVPCLEDIMLLEDTLNEIRFDSGSANASEPSLLPPYVKIICLRHDPSLLLATIVAYDKREPFPLLPVQEGFHLFRYTDKITTYPISQDIREAILNNHIDGIPPELAEKGFLNPVVA